MRGRGFRDDEKPSEPDADRTKARQVADYLDRNPAIRIGLDGMSLLMVLLTGIIGPISLVASWRDPRDPRAFGAFLLVLQGAALGVFLALDFFALAGIVHLLILAGTFRQSVHAASGSREPRSPLSSRQCFQISSTVRLPSNRAMNSWASAENRKNPPAGGSS